MSYVVFARKYRPLRFADLVGQNHITRTLGNAIAQDRVHHAYLFAGARGLGKTTAARIFAKGLVCEKGPTAEPCNECYECLAVNEGRSVDAIEIDGASNNSVDNIRNLREQVHYLPQTARRKVYIIDEVHMLSTSAFNALLKTLEEPPAHVNFVFATTEPQKVLPTILSRVNRLDFHRVSVEQLVGHLQSILKQEKSGVEPGGLRIVARAAGGSVRDSLTLLDQVIAFADDSTNVTESEVRGLLGRADRAAVADLADAILERDPAETIRRFDALVNSGHDVTVLSMQLLEHLRDLTILGVCGTRDVLPDATDSEVETLRTQAAKVDSAWLGQLFDRFSRVIDRLQTSRAQRMLVEMGLLDLAASEPLVPLGDLVARLNGLPPGGGGGGGGGEARRGGPGPRATARTDARGSRSASSGSDGPTATSNDSPAPTATASASAPAPAPEASNGAASTGAASTDAAPDVANGASRQPPAINGTAPVSANGVSHQPPAINGTAPVSANGVSHQPPAISGTTPVSTNGVSHQPPALNGTAPVSANGALHAPAVASPAPAPVTPPVEESPFAAHLWRMGASAVVAAEPTPPDAPPSDPPPSDDAANGVTTSSTLETPAVNGATVSPTQNEGPSEQAPTTTAAGFDPCSPAPLADGVIDLTSVEPFHAWELLLGRIRLVDEFQCAVLDQVGLIALGEGTVQIMASRGSFSQMELSRHPERRAQLEQAMREHFGAPFAVRLVEGEPSLPDVPSVVLVQQRRREEHRRVIEAEARSHPALLNLVQTFSGEMTRIKPLSEL